MEKKDNTEELICILHTGENECSLDLSYHFVGIFAKVVLPVSQAGGGTEAPWGPYILA